MIYTVRSQASLKFFVEQFKLDFKIHSFTEKQFLLKINGVVNNSLYRYGIGLTMLNIYESYRTLDA